MKQYLITFTILLSGLFSQMDDKAAIEKATLTYIENFFMNDYETMITVLNAPLYKHGFTVDRKEITGLYQREDLKEMMSTKRALPLKQQLNKVTVLDVFGNAASVRLETGYPNMRWVEYIHLAKIDSKWKIMNVFWDYSSENKPMKKRKKQ